MVFQTSVNQFLAAGVVGEYADDSPRRESGYILLSKDTEATAAEATLAFAANPTENDTITIGTVTYKFVSTLATANDVQIGTALSDTLTSFVHAINGTGTAGTDYYTGTQDLADLVEAEVSSSTVTLTAVAEGADGNSIALASSSGNVTETSFAGGADATSVFPQIACAFTESGVDGQAQIGGTGAFAGVLVNPKQFANYQNLKPSLTLPNGIQGGLCTFGHIYVNPVSAFGIGYVAAYENATGKINAYVNAEAIPAGFTQIANARFIKVSGGAGATAILELGN